MIVRKDIDVNAPLTKEQKNMVKKAKSLGKGYTSVLSRILEEALDDNDLIHRCL